MMLHFWLLFAIILSAFYVQVDTVISHNGMPKVFCIPVVDSVELTL